MDGGVGPGQIAAGLPERPAGQVRPFASQQTSETAERMEVSYE